MGEKDQSIDPGGGVLGASRDEIRQVSIVQMMGDIGTGSCQQKDCTTVPPPCAAAGYLVVGEAGLYTPPPPMVYCTLMMNKSKIF